MTETILFFDIINIAFALALIAVLQFRFGLHWWEVAILLFHFALIFLTNGVLFPPSYMPDQFKYLSVAQEVRGMDDVSALDRYRVAIDLAGYFFGYFPLPIINSIYSISIINFILYLGLYIFLRQNGIMEKMSLWTFLMYPSLLLYTSVSLRDTIILFFMVIGLWMFLRGRTFWAIILHLPLALLKMQNLGIIAATVLVYYLLAIFFPRISRRRVHPLVAVALLMAVTVILLYFYQYGLKLLNIYRNAFWREDMGMARDMARDNFVNPMTKIDTFGELIVETLKNIPYFLFKPLPWEAQSGLHLVQSVENLVVGACVVFIIAVAVRRRTMGPEMAFLLIYFLIALAVYGLTVWNFGTAARYKFPYVAIFLVFFSHFHRNHVGRVDRSLLTFPEPSPLHP